MAGSGRGADYTCCPACCAMFQVVSQVILVMLRCALGRFIGRPQLGAWAQLGLGSRVQAHGCGSEVPKIAWACICSALVQD